VVLTRVVAIVNKPLRTITNTDRSVRKDGNKWVNFVEPPSKPGSHNQLLSRLAVFAGKRSRLSSSNVGKQLSRHVAVFIWAMIVLFILVIYLFKLVFLDIAVIPSINSGRSLPCIPHALPVPLEPCNPPNRLTHPLQTNRVRVSTTIRRPVRTYKGYHPHPGQNRSARPQTPRSTSSDLPLSSGTLRVAELATNGPAEMKVVTR